MGRKEGRACFRVTCGGKTKAGMRAEVSSFWLKPFALTRTEIVKSSEIFERKITSSD